MEMDLVKPWLGKGFEHLFGLKSLKKVFSDSHEGNNLGDYWIISGLNDYS